MKQEKALIPGGTVSKYLSRPLTEKRTQELYRLNMTETIEEEKKKVELKELTDTLKEQIKGHEKTRKDAARTLHQGVEMVRVDCLPNYFPENNLVRFIERESGNVAEERPMNKEDWALVESLKKKSLT
jgi:hypothetical protein